MRVSIVIVTYNSGHVIGDCLSRIVGSPEIEVVLVDNNSNDDTRDLVAREFPQVRVIAGDTNVGFARAVNVGAHQATGDFVLLMNPDTRIAKSDVLKLADSLEDPSIGCVGPLVPPPPGGKVLGAGYEPTAGRMLAHATGVGRVSSCGRLAGHYLYAGRVEQKPVDVDWVSGNCLMVRREVFASLGGLSERWFMYAEDIDLCLRVRDSGRRVLVVPAASAEHAVGGSSRGVTGQANPAWIVNLYDLASLRYKMSPRHRLIWRRSVQAGFVVRIIVFWMLGKLQRQPGAMAEVLRYVGFVKALEQAEKDLFVVDQPCTRDKLSTERGGSRH